MNRILTWAAAAALLGAPAFADETAEDRAATPEQALEAEVQSEEEGLDRAAGQPVLRTPDETEVGIGGAGDEGDAEPEDARHIRRQPSAGPEDAAGTGGAGAVDDTDAKEAELDRTFGDDEEGTGGANEETGDDALIDPDFDPAYDEGLDPPTEDPSIIGQEREADGNSGGAVFDTGDTSGRSPGTIPEGSEPGPGSPMPAPEELD